jgi:aspartate/glutamate racemase
MTKLHSNEVSSQTIKESSIDIQIHHLYREKTQASSSQRKVLQQPARLISQESIVTEKTMGAPSIVIPANNAHTIRQKPMQNKNS